MFIRKVKKQRSSKSKVFFQYTLAQSSRVDGKVKQRVILYLGSETILEDDENRATVLSILKSKIFKQPELFPIEPSNELQDLANKYYEKYCIKYGDADELDHSIPPVPTQADFHNIDLKALELTDVKTFGAEYLSKQILDKLKLKEFFESLGFTETQTKKALISIVARAVFSSSEHKTAQILNSSSELKSLFSYENNISHKQLYATSDLLYKHQEEIDKFLYQQIRDMFDLEDKLVIFDISNTYFETRKDGSKLATYGRSKEKRSDCPLVVFTGVINAEGFIRHSKIYEGNKPDSATLSDMVEDLKKHTTSNSKQTIVMDAGIATEDNLELIKSKGYKYVVVSRKRIKDYPIDISKPKTVALTNRGKEKVELEIFNPKGFSDTWMYVQSDSKRKKEESMKEKLKERFEEDLGSIRNALTKKGGTKQINKVWERIGRIKQKHVRVSSRYEIIVKEKDGNAIELNFIEKSLPIKDEKEKGVYFIRTNYENPSEKELWSIYNTIREVESTFRSLKSDLEIRPVHHQKDDRIESHIYLTILAYQLVNTVRHMLKTDKINYDWKNIVRIMNTHTIQTVLLSTDKKNIHLRKTATPIEEVKNIYKATNTKNYIRSSKKYVVYH